EKYQAMPADGYAKMFDRMVASCQGQLELKLETNYRDMLNQIKFRHLVYTGPLDEFFDGQLGTLPYRSLKFEHESFTPAQLLSQARPSLAVNPGFWQPAVQVNYPNEEAFTRIVEIKHVSQQNCDNTTIVREYPDDYGPGKEPYYPIPTSQNHNL